MVPVVSDNTQTFHQALLLMSSLARLTPESVLHNVMPVFTFMGSNVFHRDDSYSFRVVQQVRFVPSILETTLICPTDRQ
jgi:U3 small nucleolar RNA-associated protein 10